MGIFAEWQPRYAKCGLATFPVRSDKTPAVQGYLKIGSQVSEQLTRKFPGYDAFGLACKRMLGKTNAVGSDNPSILPDADIRTVTQTHRTISLHLFRLWPVRQIARGWSLPATQPAPRDMRCETDKPVSATSCNSLCLRRRAAVGQVPLERRAGRWREVVPHAPPHEEHDPARFSQRLSVIHSFSFDEKA